MDIDVDLVTINQTKIEAMRQQLQEANDRGFERFSKYQQAAIQKNIAERQHRKRLLFETHFSKLPQLFEDAVANGEDTFEFFLVELCDLIPSGMGRYDPRSGTDIELVMELLQELNLIADIEYKGTINNTCVVILQTKLFE